MLMIYHNPRCSKSRAAISLLEASQLPFETKLYLQAGLDTNEVQSLITKTGGDAFALVRTSEPENKIAQLFASSSNEEICQGIVEYPKLLQRPIITNEECGIIGRPTEALADWLEHIQSES